MTLFRNDTHREVWRQRWCETCFQPDEAQRRIQGKNTTCPIWERAIRTDRKPPEWERNTRADEMHRTIRCNAYQPKPVHVRKNPQHVKQFEDVAMIDIEPHDAPLVPVEGWPDRPKKDGEVDHA